MITAFKREDRCLTSGNLAAAAAAGLSGLPPPPSSGVGGGTHAHLSMVAFMQKSSGEQVVPVAQLAVNRSPPQEEIAQVPTWSKTQTGKLLDDMRRGKGPELQSWTTYHP
eukprot:SAG22_NODE_406_length_10984_cov_28.344970_7_plen_110_part_00